MSNYNPADYAFTYNGDLTGGEPGKLIIPERPAAHTEFAAQRDTQLTSADADLRPVVEDALNMLYAGDSDWFDDLVAAAEDLWLTTYAETGTDPDLAAIRSFADTLGQSLEETSTAPGFVTDSQTDTVTRWVSTYTVNDATSAAALDTGGQVVWVTMRDDDVRDSHRAVDGEIQPAGGTFEVDGFALHYPGEPVGPPETYINCRCVLMPLEAQMTAAADAPPADLTDEVTDADEPTDGYDDLEHAVPWHGVIAPVEAMSGDRRMFAAGSISHRDLPLPLRWQKVDDAGHKGSVVIGNITDLWEDDGLIRAAGMFASNAEAGEVIALIAEGMLRGVSVDLDGDTAFDLVNDDGTSFDVDAYTPGDPDPIMRVTDGRVTSASIVAIPAFQEAFVALGPPEQTSDQVLTAAGDCIPCAAKEMDDYFEELAAEAAQYAISEAAWDGSASRFDDAQWRRSCVVDRGASHQTAKERYAVPIKEPSGALSRAAVHNAAGRINQVDAPAAAIAAGKRKLAAAYRTLGEDPPESLTATAAAWLGEYVVDTHDAPGWVTHPAETQRLRRYWTRGKGAAKIGWGTPGDFRRCEAQLRKYIPNPQHLAGTCANMHYVALGTWPGRHSAASITASGDTAPAFTLVASAEADGADLPPAEWFTDPQLDGPTPLTVQGRRVFGHLATWGVCHVGLGLSVGDGDVCVTAPNSPSGYAYYMVHAQRTADGETIPVGHITLGTGHAPASMASRPAAAHYDNTGSVVASVAVGEDEHGIWFSGALAPDADPDKVAGAVLSGDWRTIGDSYELVAALGVNVPGFPIPRLQLAASGDRGHAVIAAGIVPPRSGTEQFDRTSLVTDVYNRMQVITQRADRRHRLVSRMRSVRRAQLTSRLGG